MSNAVRRDVGSNGTTFLKPAMLISANLNAIESHPHRDDPQVRFVLAETLTALASAEVYKLVADNVVDPERLADNRRFQWRTKPKQPRILRQTCQTKRRAGRQDRQRIDSIELQTISSIDCCLAKATAVSERSN